MQQLLSGDDDDGSGDKKHANADEPRVQPHVATRFSEDRRLEEVERVLQSTEPVTVSGTEKPSLTCVILGDDVRT